MVVNAEDVEFVRAFGGVAQVRRYSAGEAMRMAGFKVVPGVFPEAASGYDAIVLPLENGRGLARAMMIRSMAALVPGGGGSLWVGGPVRAGARTYEDDAAKLGAVERVYSGGGCRLFRVTRGETLNAIPAEWGSPGEMQAVPFEVRGRGFVQYTQAGVFSADGLDEGTRFLLEALSEVKVAKGCKVLDACCGAGAIGLVVAAEHDAEVTYADDDLLALDCCRATVGAGPTVVAADLTRSAPGGKFDLIVCNPPFHQGLSEDRSFVPKFVPVAAKAVGPGGRMVMVANRFLPYEQDLARAFEFVTVVAEDRRWRVWEAGGARK